MITYPEMNAQIVQLLRTGGENYELYAADRIEELEGEKERLANLLRCVLEWCEQEDPNFEIDADAIRRELENN